MKIKDWQIAAFNEKLKKTQILPMFFLRRFLNAMFDQNGFLRCDNIQPLLVFEDEKNICHYLPIKRIVSGYVQTTDLKLYCLPGLERYTKKFKFSDGKLVISHSTPYEQQKIQVFSVTGRTHIVNEDSYLGISHPNNPNLKLLVVADGMGGHDFGNLASKLLVNQLKNWFLNEKIANLNNTKFVYENLSTIIRHINDVMHREFAIKRGLNSGSTLALALINSTDTIIANVGDSRIGALMDGNLNIISIDDSPLVTNTRPPTPMEQDMIRVMPGNNFITQYMGNISVRPHLNVIKNSNYTDIFLFSDGITDCVNYNTLNQIARNVDKVTLFKFITAASYGQDDEGAKAKASDDETVVHYSKR